jgi:hypothetical protein
MMLQELDCGVAGKDVIYRCHQVWLGPLANPQELI